MYLPKSLFSLQSSVSFIIYLPLQQVQQNPQTGQAGKSSVIIGTMLLLDLFSKWAPLIPLCSAEEEKEVSCFWGFATAIESSAFSVHSGLLWAKKHSNHQERCEQRVLRMIPYPYWVPQQFQHRLWEGQDFTLQIFKITSGFDRGSCISIAVRVNKAIY